MGFKTNVINGKTYATHGYKPSTKPPVFCRDFSSPRGIDLPEKVDLRKYCTAVEDQGAHNSCAANAVASAYEYLCKKQCMETGDKTGDISRMFIYWVGRKAMNVYLNQPNAPIQDQGMSLSIAIEAMQRKGACLESNWAYSPFKVNTKPPTKCFAEAMRYKVSEAVSVPISTQKMKEALAEGYPVVFGMKLTRSFMTPPRSGKIATPNRNDPQSANHGMHAMICVGYNDRQEVFIVRNSWGTRWGDQGYCYVGYDYLSNPDFSFEFFQIKGLTDCDFTPDDDDGQESFDPTLDSDGDGIPDIEEQENDWEDGEADEYDGDMFDPAAETRRVFDAFDMDGSGSINATELSMALMCNGFPFPSKEEVQQAIQKADTDGNGQLSFEEFEALVATRPIKMLSLGSTSTAAPGPKVKLEIVMKGEQLAQKDNSMAQGYKCDPYLYIRLDNEQGELLLDQSKNYQAQTLDPTFDKFTLEVSNDATLWIQVYDHDTMARDDIVGRCTNVKVTDLMAKKTMQLEDYKASRPAAELQAFKDKQPTWPGVLVVESITEL
eukprot:CAMPEP_0181316098 /NCGR_PEP_ID=MMETSP1101-20121128/15715_1 /TAXON_ID=46948 /ORGANISM="Rhodomonas abbreviata, Strain Caron Lab Isolate" /LENGTH=548 /DNA_ID=CAMNT_0023423325 /DNA_START=32 /DNA_END=1678 /DNA_ORIENTATION=+